MPSKYGTPKAHIRWTPPRKRIQGKTIITKNYNSRIESNGLHIGSSPVHGERQKEVGAVCYGLMSHWG